MIHHGDCLDILPTLEAESIDAIVTDPPYGLEFMGKEWDRLGDVRQRGDADFTNGDRRHGLVRHGGSASYGAKAVEASRAMQDWHHRWTVEAFRVAKPGAHLLAFGGTRTYHRLACAIEDAGWEVRDCLVWAYASGFPKSLDVSKAIDKAAGATPRVVGPHPSNTCPGGEWCKCETDGRSFSPTRHPAATAPATPEAAKWQGWGTALKPAWEPIILARKPLRGTVAANVQEYGTGALNIDATRLPTGDRATSRDGSGNTSGGSTSGSGLSPVAVLPARSPGSALRAWSVARPEAGSAPLASALADVLDHRAGLGSQAGYLPCPRCDGGRARIAEAVAREAAPLRLDVRAARLSPEWSASRIRESRCDDHHAIWDELARLVEEVDASASDNDTTDVQRGRWPPNLLLTDPIFDGDMPGVVGGGAQDSPASYVRGVRPERFDDTAYSLRVPEMVNAYGDTGTYSRFFLIPKADRRDREPVLGGDGGRVISVWGGDEDDLTPGKKSTIARRNHHPTVKPTDLMRHLVRLVTPPGGIVLDPFLGSGTTALAAEMEGFRWVGIEREEEYVRIAEARLNGTQRGLGLAG